MSLQLTNLQHRPLLWVSCVRLLAVFLIYAFHFQVLRQANGFYFDLTGISFFCFISGYFSFLKSENPHRWLVKRFKQILIPYWIVIVPVLAANELAGYKATSWVRNVVISMGGSMFLYNPVYVISWFITLILMFYTTAYVLRVVRNVFLRILFVLVVLILLYIRFEWRIPFYCCVYLSGLCYGYYRTFIAKPGPVPSGGAGELARILFRVQSYGYSFFLIHGGVLIVCFKVLHWDPAVIFVLAALVTAAVSLVHKRVSDWVLARV